MRMLLILAGFLLSSAAIHAQKYYAVMVTDAKTGAPIKGAVILNKSTGVSVPTSENGNVVVTAFPEDSLQVKLKGYRDRQISLKDQAVAISIVMEPKPEPEPVPASAPVKKKSALKKTAKKY